MGLKDPVVVVCDLDHDLPYYLIRGKETFYVRCDEAEDPFHYKVDCWACDHLDEHIRFKELEECILYAREVLGVDPLEHLNEIKKKRIARNDIGQFRKNHIPWNKGLKGYNPSPETQFRLGNRPNNAVPIGSAVIVKGYVRVKIGEPNIWRQRSHISWEASRGRALPNGWIVRHKDNNPLNDDPHNLEAMSRGRSLIKTLENPEISARRKKNLSKSQRARWQEYRLSKYDIYYWRSESSDD